jgi:hypothetical protein
MGKLEDHAVLCAVIERHYTGHEESGTDWDSRPAPRRSAWTGINLLLRSAVSGEVFWC